MWQEDEGIVHERFMFPSISNYVILKINFRMIFLPKRASYLCFYLITLDI